jgi:hypothetical protein
MVFLNSPHRETPKNVIKKKRQKIGLGCFVDFFVIFFDTIFCKTFFVVFLNSHRCETPENAIKKTASKISIVLDICKNILRCF